MDYLIAIISGIIQGIFEWLPISSQGNLLGFFTLASINLDSAIELSIFLHIGTMFAAIIYFRKEIIDLIKSSLMKIKSLDKKNKINLRKKDLENYNFARFLFIATASTAITAIPSYFFLRKIVGTNVTTSILILIALMLIVTGIIQIKQTKKQNKIDNTNELSIRNAIAVGLMQGFSIIPGISRSGMTTATLLFLNFKPENVFKISFLMSIPAVIIAEIGFGIIEGFTITQYSIVAVTISFIVGLISIDLLIKFAKKINFSLFCFILALIYIVASIII
ncbi:MAG: undecaprenyl-diphosphate phosphatase [Candidatus ainarchaeum sp.]|nr:undecaprenyl-diphosphate phosphatase [Candidatus ainarchaeum sp.]